MSEYQYYEFQAIDRALTQKEMAFLRGYSTRATITPTSFVNEYHWGNFKGSEDAWMDRLFDAFLYTANWGTNILKVRVPSTRLSLAKARTFCAGDAITARQKLGNTIITMTSNDETGDWEGNHHTLASTISIRNDLVRGDMRALYLGWLAAVQNDEVDENAMEPPVPAGLGHLDASLHALIEFLRIDDSLLRAAASESPPLAPPKRRALAAWIKALPAKDKDNVLVRVLADGPYAAIELRDRFYADHGSKERDKNTELAAQNGPRHRLVTASRSRGWDISVTKRATTKNRKASPDVKRFAAMAEEATVDAYGESEQICGWACMFDHHVAVPFETIVLGDAVTVEAIEQRGDTRIVAICKRARSRQAIDILDLPLPSSPPAGAEWIDAYRHWRKGW